MPSNLEGRLRRLERKPEFQRLPPLVFCGYFEDDPVVSVSAWWTQDGNRDSEHTSAAIDSNRLCWDVPPLIEYSHHEDGRVGLISISWSENGDWMSWHASAGVELPHELIKVITKYPCRCSPVNPTPLDP